MDLSFCFLLETRIFVSLDTVEDFDLSPHHSLMGFSCCYWGFLRFYRSQLPLSFVNTELCVPWQHWGFWSFVLGFIFNMFSHWYQHGFWHRFFHSERVSHASSKGFSIFMDLSFHGLLKTRISASLDAVEDFDILVYVFFSIGFSTAINITFGTYFAIVRGFLLFFSNQIYFTLNRILPQGFFILLRGAYISLGIVNRPWFRWILASQRSLLAQFRLPLGGKLLPISSVQR